LNRRAVGMVSLVLGLLLFVVTSLGEWTNLGRLAHKPPRAWEQFDETLVDRATDLTTLFAVAEERAGEQLVTLPKDQAMRVLFEVTIERLTHGESMHTPWSNWLLWLGGWMHPALGAVRSPDNLLAHGSSALCSESSSVLMQLALRADIPTRHVGLNGHVVMEAWYNNRWHMYDPDYEVIPNEHGVVLDTAALTTDEATLRSFYAARLSDSAGLNRLVAYFMSGVDNSFVAYPPGSQFEWKSQVLLQLEEISEWLKFLLPLALMLCGVWSLLRNKKPVG
jgi:hypothetical protein